ncbi:MAG: alpha/beta fold hydrolase [Asgard group archaeon]|nr:alpha/beta fold hydrolase [Asgard group archaeon]
MNAIKETTDYFTSYDQQQLFYRVFAPKNLEKNPKKVFLGIHGAFSHSENLRTIAEFLTQQGYLFYAFDRRGEGHWDQKKSRGHISSYQKYIKDIKAFHAFIKQHNKSSNIYYVGHSMGGAQALIMAIDFPNLVDGVIVSSPCIRLSMLTIKRRFLFLMAKMMCFLFPGMRISHGVKMKEVISDKKIRKKREQDSLGLDKITTCYTRELFKTGKYVSQHFPKLPDIPIFFILSGKDNLVDNNYTKNLYEEHLAKRSNVKLKIYPEHLHENFNELPKNRQKVFSDIKEFVTQQ